MKLHHLSYAGYHKVYSMLHFAQGAIISCVITYTHDTAGKVQERACYSPQL